MIATHSPIVVQQALARRVHVIRRLEGDLPDEARGQLAYAVIWGVRRSIWKKLVAHLSAEAAVLTQVAVVPRWPLRRLDRVSRGQLFAVIEAAIDSGQPVLIALSGAHSHYSVICGYSDHRFVLFDSSRYRWLARSSCGPQEPAALAASDRHPLTGRAGGRLVSAETPNPVSPGPPPDDRRMTLRRFRLLEGMLRDHGYADMIAWSEGVTPPRDCRAFAKEAIYVICNSGMRVTIATAIYWRCIRALARRQSAATVFGHPGKAAAIDHIWQHRKVLFDAYRIAENKLVYCETLPFVGPVTRHHLAKNLGLNTVKPDVHLARLAKAERIGAWDLCARLAAQTGYREATIDTILWRACADGLLNSDTYLIEGWRAAINRMEVRLHLLRLRAALAQTPAYYDST